jgi:hypothetical protein
MSTPPSPPEPVRGVTSDPSDNTTLTDVLEDYRRGGYGSEFSALEGEIIACSCCGSEISAQRFTVLSRRRLEGASDPDDMMSVVATACPACAAQGVLVLGVGPMAPAEHADIARAMQDGRSTDRLPGDATPAEAAGTAAELTDEAAEGASTIGR